MKFTFGVLEVWMVRFNYMYKTLRYVAIKSEITWGRLEPVKNTFVGELGTLHAKMRQSSKLGNVNDINLPGMKRIMVELNLAMLHGGVLPVSGSK